MCDKNEEVTSIKEQGNCCLKGEKYAEAILHYSHAIKLDENNYSLYSNRSLAFLKIQQFHFALKDAQEAIQLKPDWAKGYFRKAEVEFHTFHFSDALISYKIALTLQPNDPSLKECVEKTVRAMVKDEQADRELPWVAAAVGIVISAVLVVADHFLTSKPTLSHPVAMLVTTVGIAMAGYFLTRGYRSYIKNERSAMLEPPADLFKENSDSPAEENEKEKENRPRYSKAQARQRFKRGRT